MYPCRVGLCPWPPLRAEAGQVRREYADSVPDTRPIGEDNDDWNWNMMQAVCAVESAVRAGKASFYYPAEGSIVALMRYGRNIGTLPLGRNTVETENDIDVMVEVPEGVTERETFTHLERELGGEWSCDSALKNGAANCKDSVWWWTCRHSSRSVHADFEFYTSKTEGGVLYALNNCYSAHEEARPDLKAIPLSVIRDAHSSSLSYCAFLPYQLLLPCPTNAAELSRVWQNGDTSRDMTMKHVVLPDAWGDSQYTESDLQELDTYAQQLRKIGALSYKDELEQIKRESAAASFVEVRARGGSKHEDKLQGLFEDGIPGSNKTEMVAVQANPKAVRKVVSGLVGSLRGAPRHSSRKWPL